MKLGPLEVSWNPPAKLESRVREHMTHLVDEDAEIRAIIARCARSAAKDWADERKEADAAWDAAARESNALNFNQATGR